jgi:hypothetical protein
MFARPNFTVNKIWLIVHMLLTQNVSPAKPGKQHSERLISLE